MDANFKRKKKKFAEKYIQKISFPKNRGLKSGKTDLLGRRGKSGTKDLSTTNDGWDGMKAIGGGRVLRIT